MSETTKDRYDIAKEVFAEIRDDAHKDANYNKKKYEKIIGLCINARRMITCYKKRQIKKLQKEWL